MKKRLNENQTSANEELRRVLVGVYLCDHGEAQQVADEADNGDEHLPAITLP